ncbi:hypothetical protein [Streptomyces sp. LARHCF252]
MRLPRSAPGWTMAVIGVPAAVLGAVGLVSPTAQLSLLGLAAPGERAAGDSTPAFMTASSMAALNMGVYYVLAALADWRSFLPGGPCRSGCSRARSSPSPRSAGGRRTSSSV